MPAYGHAPPWLEAHPHDGACPASTAVRAPVVPLPHLVVGATPHLLMHGVVEVSQPLHCVQLALRRRGKPDRGEGCPERARHSSHLVVAGGVQEGLVVHAADMVPPPALLLQHQDGVLVLHLTLVEAGVVPGEDGVGHPLERLLLGVEALRCRVDVGRAVAAPVQHRLEERAHGGGQEAEEGAVAGELVVDGGGVVQAIRHRLHRHQRRARHALLERREQQLLRHGSHEVGPLVGELLLLRRRLRGDEGRGGEGGGEAPQGGVYAPLVVRQRRLQRLVPALRQPPPELRLLEVSGHPRELLLSLLLCQLRLHRCF
mmetsp:Transcript_30141/g.65857  ORF Transcript_30141/g.65857 Transcript_30141/m.65857 type:complete len:315 (-) Transcript_30141:364-1308(-)